MNFSTYLLNLYTYGILNTTEVFKIDNISPAFIMTASEIANRQIVIVLDLCVQRGVTYVNY